MCITVSSLVWDIPHVKTVQTFWPFHSEHSHFRHVTSFTTKNVRPASTSWSHSISNKPCMHDCQWINGSEEQICHWSSWDEALPWRMGLCLWNERMMENDIQHHMHSTAFCQYQNHTDRGTHTLGLDTNITPQPEGGTFWQRAMSTLWRSLFQVNFDQGLLFAVGIGIQKDVPCTCSSVI